MMAALRASVGFLAVPREIITWKQCIRAAKRRAKPFLDTNFCETYSLLFAI